MYRSRSTNLAVGLLIAAVSTASGCQFVPRWARLSRPDNSHSAQLAAAVEALDQLEATSPRADPEADKAGGEQARTASKSKSGVLLEDSESAELKEFIAELEEYPEIDLADRNEILQQLHQTEPGLLKLVIRQYRANLALERQRREKKKNRQLAATEATSQTDADAVVATDVSPVVNAEAKTQPSARALAASVEPKDKPAEPEKPVETALAADTDSAQGIAAGSPVRRLPEMQESPVMRAADPPRLSIADRLLQTSYSSAGRLNGPVVAASFDGKFPADWRDQLKATIGGLESSVNQTPESAEEISDHARLRLLCLAAQQRDEALRPIPTLDTEMTEFWSEELFGLSVLLDTEMLSDPAHRLSEAKLHFEEAINRLGESAPLVVRNLAFITKVVSYGVYTTFDDYEFTPDQRVGLYVEVENFSSKEGPQGFSTSLKSSYQILDGRGQRVTVNDFIPNQDSCRNRRRDYFIFYEFNMPERIYPGEYTLKLTVTDVNSEKVGESQLQFYISG